jgi:hypothetical protein
MWFLCCFVKVEASTLDISREVASVHKDVTAILNLLLKQTKLQHNEHLPTQVTVNHDDSPPTPPRSALLPVRDASPVRIQQLSAPQSQQTIFTSTLATSHHQSPAIVEPKPLFKEYSMSTHDVTVTATIVMLAESNDGDSQAVAAAMTAKTQGGYGATSGGNTGSCSTPAATVSHNNSFVGLKRTPADSETVQQNSTMEGLDLDQLTRPAFISAPGAPVVQDTPLLGSVPSCAPGSEHQARHPSCVSRDDGNAGDVRVGYWRSSWVTINRDSGCHGKGVCSPTSSETMNYRNEFLPGLRRNVLELAGPPSQEGSALPLESEADTNCGTPQSTRSCKGRWVGGVRRRGSSVDDSSVGAEMGPTSPPR